jgi:hypothetical protein
MSYRVFSALAALAALALLSTSAEAKSARCFTTDDGEYDCTFVATDADGGFEISAPGKPTFFLLMTEPGVASAYGDYSGDGHNVMLPGRYLRSESDPACWANEDTETQICAW